MSKISVVIITKNEAGNIADCIISAKKISNDIIVIDSGSTDATASLAKSENASVQSIVWNGYGYSKNTGALLAENDWILSLDADERITSDLADTINSIVFSDERFIYGFKRVNYFSDKKIRYGSFAHDTVFRLYNRRHSQWNIVPVHEKLTGEKVKWIKIRSFAMHYAILTEAHYQPKITNYALLCALKYQKEEKRFVTVRSLISPAFNFFKGYILQLGLLDHREGFIIAKLNAVYTWKKYQLLQALMEEEKRNKKRPYLLNSFRNIISFLSQ